MGDESGSLERTNLVERFAERIRFDLQVMVALLVDPELWGRLEVAFEPQRGIRGDAPFAVHDLIDAARWRTYGDGESRRPGESPRSGEYQVADSAALSFEVTHRLAVGGY